MKSRRLLIPLFTLTILHFAGCLSSAPRKLLFFDLWKLDYWDNVELKQGEPEWQGEGTYTDPSFPDRGIVFPSVWKDKASGQWRMVYSVKWSPFTLMASESKDGVRWTPLPLPGVTPPNGMEKLAPNHVLTVPNGSGSGVYIDPQETDGYKFRIFGRLRGKAVLERALADPKHPWHEVAKKKGETRYMDEGVTYVSKDGLRWEVKAGGHWNWQDKDWYPEPPVFAFWDAANQQHVMAARPGWGDRRQCLRVSKDLKTWSAPELLFQPDPLDTRGTVSIYGLPVLPVGNGAGYVGLLWMFHNSSSEPVNSYNQYFGPMDNQLVYSYDGKRFTRGLRQPFIRRNPIPQPGCAQVRTCSIVETEDSILVYSEGSKGAHGRERSQQRLAGEESIGSLLVHKLRKDGWMYLASSGDWAHFQTKPFTLREPGIYINAAANYGEVRFQLTDERSVPLEGYSFADSLPLRGKDALRFPLRWKNSFDPGKILLRPLRLEVKFRQANIYSLEMDHHFIDAHDMWLLKDGMPLPNKPRFDF